jgi:hypothetical protein
VSGLIGCTFPHKGLESSPSPDAKSAYHVEDIATAHVRLEGGLWMTLNLASRAAKADTDWASSCTAASHGSSRRCGEAPPTVAEEGLTIQAITDAVYASAESGREIVLHK